MNDIKRGEMFYISRGGASYNGSEQHADRPDDLRLYERLIQERTEKENEQSHIDG